MCWGDQVAGRNRRGHEHSIRHYSGIYWVGPHLTTHILFLTSASIKSWPGVWVAGPELTGTATHRSYRANGQQIRSSSEHYYTLREHCLIYRHLLKNHGRRLKVFLYRRRCCRMVMLNWSRRRDGSNAAASTSSFFFIKLQGKTQTVSECVTRRFKGGCFQVYNATLYFEGMSHALSPNNQTDWQKF